MLRGYLRWERAAVQQGCGCQREGLVMLPEGAVPRGWRPRRQRLGGPRWVAQPQPAALWVSVLWLALKGARVSGCAALLAAQRVCRHPGVRGGCNESLGNFVARRRRPSKTRWKPSICAPFPSPHGSCARPIPRRSPPQAPLSSHRPAPQPQVSLRWVKQARTGLLCSHVALDAHRAAQPGRQRTWAAGRRGLQPIAAAPPAAPTAASAPILKTLDFPS